MTYTKPEAKVICDSIGPAVIVPIMDPQRPHWPPKFIEQPVRVITVQAKIHRWVLAELNTHRVFTRSSASSRAIPAAKIREMALNETAMPVRWGTNRPGMQSMEDMNMEEMLKSERAWLTHRDEAVNRHMQLEKIGLHKQWVNRILEPFLFHTVIITATEWANFFAQRSSHYSPDAQPEMKAAADAIYYAIKGSDPTFVPIGEYHTPFIKGGGDADYVNSITSPQSIREIAVARCGRVSYLSHDGKHSMESDLELFHKLKTAKPGHWAPLEHVATPSEWETHGNLRMWKQYRHQFDTTSHLPGVFPEDWNTAQQILAKQESHDDEG